MSNSRGKTIAINSVAMFVRTFITLFITLYTSRVTLTVLGVEDFGIYNLVAGVVLFLSFFSGPLTKMAVRFLSFEQGNSSSNGISSVFSACLALHMGIIVFFIFGGFIVGYPLVKTLNIPIVKLDVAVILFFLSLLTLAFHVIKIPYESLLLSYEKMTHYAVICVLDSIFKLVGILILSWFKTTEILIIYGWLLLFESFLIFLITLIITKIVCPTYKLVVPDKAILKQMSTFAGWSMIGGSADIITQSGFSMLINVFYGVFVNAALGIMNQVQSALSRFMSSFSMAYNPQVIKAYADKKLDDMHTLICSASKLSFLLLSLPALPLYFNMDFILRLWLGEVPNYAADFCCVVIVVILIDSVTSVYNTSITATGKIRNYQILISLSFALDLFVSFILLKIGVLPTTVLISRIFTRGILNMMIGLFFMKKHIYFDINNYIRYTIMPIFIYTAISSLFFWLICNIMHSELLRLSASVAIYIPFSCISIFLFVLNNKEKSIVLSLFKKK